MVKETPALPEIIGLAIGIEVSANKKIGRVSATYSAQESCPDDCPWQGSGCYAETGHVGIHTARLNRTARETGATHLDVAISEAAAIGRLTGRFPLRLHIVGDCRDNESAGIVAGASARYQSLHGQPVWSYTHAWRVVDRSTWGIVSILASCDAPDQLADAHARGYATALVVPDPHTDRRAKPIPGTDFVGIPCPQQTGAAESCETCRLCWRDDILRASRRTILFAPDGTTGKRITAAMRDRVPHRTVAVRLPVVQ
jgi:hypothetical protein